MQRFLALLNLRPASLLSRRMPRHLRHCPRLPLLPGVYFMYIQLLSQALHVTSVPHGVLAVPTATSRSCA